MIGRGNREIAFLVARPVAQVIVFAAGVPAAFFGIDEIETAVLVLIEANIVEDEELGLGSKVGGIGNTAVFELQFRLLGDPARIAVVVLARNGVDDVAEHDQCPGLRERIHEGSGGIGNDEHVALVNRRPAADAGAVDSEAIFKRALIEHADGIRDVLVQSGQVGKAQIDLPGIVLLGELKSLLWGHRSSRGTTIYITGRRAKLVRSRCRQER